MQGVHPPSLAIWIVLAVQCVLAHSATDSDECSLEAGADCDGKVTQRALLQVHTAETAAYVSELKRATKVHEKTIEAHAQEISTASVEPWALWREHHKFRFLAFPVIILAILAIMAMILGGLELIIRFSQNHHKAYLHHLNEQEHKNVADKSTKAKTSSDVYADHSHDRRDVKHFVHGSQKEDIWSFVDGDEGRFKTLLDLPQDLQKIKDEVIRVEKVLHVDANEAAVEEVANSLAEIRELVQAPDFQKEIENNLHDEHTHKCLHGDEEQAINDKWANGEKHAHSGFKDIRLQGAHAVHKYFAGENFMDHMVIAFVFVYSQLCGVLYAWYIHEVHVQENTWMETPVVEPPLQRILLARSQAMALIIATLLMVLLLTRGVCTRVRSIVDWSTVLAAMVDKHVLVHKSCGYMLVFASFVHCLGHLLQTMWNIYQGEPLVYDFKGWPAITGYILWVILIGFCGLSSNYVRRKAFEWFFYPHLVLVILWTFFLIAHGGTQWFSFGLPLASISVLPAVFVYFVERYFHVRWGSDETIHIAHATVRDKMVMVTIDIGKSKLKYETGQYSMLMVPEIAGHEWHPFTIASGGGQQQFDLLIAVAGDWTKQFHDELQKAQKRHATAVKQLALSAADSTSLRKGPSAVDSTPVYPSICVRGGYGAPAEGMKGKHYVVMVGGGVGATPFLSFLSAACNAAQIHECAVFPGLRRAIFYWVSRDPSDFTFVNKYNSIISKNPALATRLEIKLCMTKTMESAATKEVNKDEIALFWLGVQRALRKPKENKEVAAMLGVPTQFGRPNWEEEFAHVSQELQKMEGDAEADERFEISVFACGNPMLTESLEEACAANTDRNVMMRLYAEEF